MDLRYYAFLNANSLLEIGEPIRSTLNVLLPLRGIHKINYLVKF